MTDLSQLRVPPHSMEAEQSLLGGLLLDPPALDRIAGTVVASDFYRHEHRLIYAAAAAMSHAGQPIDVVTMFERLGSEDVTLEYLNALAQSVPSASNIKRYAEIVRDRAILRKLIAAADEIAAEAFNTGTRPPAQVLDSAESKILAIAETGAHRSGGPTPIADVIPALIDRVTELSEAGGDGVIGLRTGYTDLDRLTSGLQPGDLVVLAARPSMGKTALALNIAEHAAVKDGESVLVFSMEMSSQQLALRMVGSLGRINSQRLRTGRMEDDDFSRMSEAVEKIARADLHIDDTSGLTVAEVRARARRLARRRKLGLIVVDYLQLMAGNGEENRATEVGEISRGLKALAKELRCPVLALSQLNRGVEARGDKRPMMSDLRESGSIEQDADVIMFIYRDDYYNKESKDAGVAEVIIAKQRSGPVDTVRLTFVSSLTRFESMAFRA